MRAVMSLVRAWIAGIGGFAMITAAFLVAMTLAISGPPTADEMAGLESATQTAFREADRAARSFGDDMCVRLDLDCAPQQARVEPPQRVAPPVETTPKPPPAIVAEVVPPPEPDPPPSLAGSPTETQTPPPQARERAARRTPDVRARRAAAREERVRPHRRESTAARPHRAPRPRRSPPITGGRPHAPPQVQAPVAAPPAVTPRAETPQVTEVSAPEPVAEAPAPDLEREETPSAVRNRTDRRDADTTPAAELNAREQEGEPAEEAPPPDGGGI